MIDSLALATHGLIASDGSCEAHSARDPVISGTWYTPSEKRLTLVTLQFEADDVGSGDTAAFELDIRDLDDVVLSGYPVRWEYARGGLGTGIDNTKTFMTFVVPAGHDYRITDQSSGVGAVRRRAIESQL